MESGFTIRWGWLRAMYLYTLVGAGGLGFGLIVFPAATKAMMGFPARDPGVLGLYSCYRARRRTQLCGLDPG